MIKKFIFFLFIFFHALTSSASENIARQAYDAGMRAYDRKEYQNAVYAFENSIYYDPLFYDSYPALGLSYKFNGERKKAETTFLDNIDKFPKNWESYLHLADMFYENDGYDEALSYYKKALLLETFPKNEINKTQKKVKKLEQIVSQSWQVTETKKNQILANITSPLSSDLWRASVVEKKPNALHVVYSLKQEDYRSGKWSEYIDLTCTKTDDRSENTFNRLNDWISAEYSRLNTDLDTLEITSNSRLFETFIHSKNTSIMGYIFPAKGGFCIIQHFSKMKNRKTKNSGKKQNILKSFIIRDF